VDLYLIIVLCRSQPIILAPSTFPYHFHHRHGHTMFPSSCMLSLLLSLHPPFSFRIYILCCTSGLTSVNETGRIYSLVGKVNSIHFIITGVNHYAHNLHISNALLSTSTISTTFFRSTFLFTFFCIVPI